MGNWGIQDGAIWSTMEAKLQSYDWSASRDCVILFNLYSITLDRFKIILSESWVPKLRKNKGSLSLNKNWSQKYKWVFHVVSSSWCYLLYKGVPQICIWMTFNVEWPAGEGSRYDSPHEYYQVGGTPLYTVLPHKIKVQYCSWTRSKRNLWLPKCVVSLLQSLSCWHLHCSIFICVFVRLQQQTNLWDMWLTSPIAWFCPLCRLVFIT